MFDFLGFILEAPLLDRKFGHAFKNLRGVDSRQVVLALRSEFGVMGPVDCRCNVVGFAPE